MKKFYLIGLMGLGICAQAQTQVQTSKTSINAIHHKKHGVDYEIPSPVRELNYPKQSKLGKAQVGGIINTRIGSTMFAQQTNGTIYRRTFAYPNGKVSATWTTSSDNGTNGYLSRGSAYNTFDGNNWANSAMSSPRIEAFRTGYPSLTSNGTKEYIISHRVDTSGKSNGMVMNSNAGIGSQTWASETFFAPPAGVPSQLWPRTIVSGDYLILLANYQDSSDDQPSYVYKNGVKSPMVYSRYKISTSTWVDQDLTLPDYDYDVFTEGNSDIYSMDANGNNVAIVAGYAFSNLVLWKSADNGATWTKKIIDSFPVPHYQYDVDTFNWIQANDGTANVIVDNNGKAHVFSGMVRIKDSVPGGGYVFSRNSFIGGVNDAILYWSEYNPDSSLTPILSALQQGGDTSIADGSFIIADRRYGISNSTWATAGIDDQGRIYVVYSALTPGDLTQDGTNANYRDILISYSSDNGTTWAEPQNASQHLGSNIEQIFPNAARFVDSRVHLTYLTKIMPGLTVPPSNIDVFEINYMSIPVEHILAGTVGITEVADKPFSVNQNYPNPFHGATTFDVNFKRSSNATVTISDIMGRVISEQVFEQVPTGKSSLTIHMNDIPAGVYLYTIEADGYKTTAKMMVN